MKVYLLYRDFECVDCGNEGRLEGIYLDLRDAMQGAADAGEVGPLWIEDRSGPNAESRRWVKARGIHYIEEWPTA